jgi:hypothetical protein
MAKETKEERRLRIQKEVAEESAARREAYFKAQEESKAKAAAAAAPLPQPDAYVYDYAWRQGVGTPEGELKLIKSPNPYYDASTNTIVDPATGERTDATQSMVSGASTSSDSLYDAKRAAGYGMDTQGNQYRGAGTQGDPLTINGSPFTGTWQGKTYENGIVKTVTSSPVTTQPVISTGLDADTLALIQSLKDQIATLSANTQQAAIDKAAADAAAKQEKAENAIAVLTDRFTRYGLASLVPRIKQLAISGASESTITLQLQESEEYKTRFKANQDRIKKGLRVLDPGDYLNLEDDYRQILRAYGLKAFDTDAYVQQFIANDIATTELSNRVVTAVQRVQNADPAILTTLRSFYGISDNDLVAYVLDPNQQFQKIERQVAAAEIGAAAGLQGISTGVSVAEQLAAQGVTKAQAQKGYSTIADILPTSEKLSGIYDKALPSYGLAEAEQEVFNTLASAQRKRRALAEREIAEFSGASGLSKSALSKQIGGTY